MSETQNMSILARKGNKRKLAFQMMTVAACALTLVACKNRNDITGSVPDNYRLRHPISLKQAARTIDIPVGIHSEKLPPASRSAIRNFAREFRADRATSVEIMLPSGSENESNARYVSRNVKTELLRTGLQPAEIRLVSYSAHSASDAPIRLAYPRMLATSPKCEGFLEQLAREYDNRSYSNFGCATQANFAAQVANPQDLIQPRGWDPRDAGRRGIVNEKYRNGEPTWSEDLGSSVGSSSEVQK